MARYSDRNAVYVILHLVSFAHTHVHLFITVITQVILC